AAHASGPGARLGGHRAPGRPRRRARALAPGLGPSLRRGPHGSRVLRGVCDRPRARGPRRLLRPGSPRHGDRSHPGAARGVTMTRRELLAGGAAMAAASVMRGAAEEPVARLVPPAKGTIPVAFVISNDATMIDFTGPWEVFQDCRVEGRGSG